MSADVIEYERPTAAETARVRQGIERHLAQQRERDARLADRLDEQANHIHALAGELRGNALARPDDDT